MLVSQSIVNGIHNFVVFGLIVHVAVATLFAVDKLVAYGDFKIPSHIRCSLASYFQLIGEFALKLFLQVLELGGVTSGAAIHDVNFELGHD